MHYDTAVSLKLLSFVVSVPILLAAAVYLIMRVVTIRK